MSEAAEMNWKALLAAQTSCNVDVNWQNTTAPTKHVHGDWPATFMAWGEVVTLHKSGCMPDTLRDSWGKLELYSELPERELSSGCRVRSYVLTCYLTKALREMHDYLERHGRDVGLFRHYKEA